MKIKNLAAVYWLIMLCISVSAQEKENPVTINLPDSASINTDNIMVILFENNDYKAFAAYEIFMQELKDQSEKSRPAKKLFDLFKERSVNSSFNADSLLADKYMSEKLKYIKASLLTVGKCHILNRQTNTLEKNLTLEYYHNKYSMGRKFLINGNLLFDVADGTK